MNEETRWAKLEEIVRRVVREELASLGKKPKIELVNGKWVGITEEQMNAWEAAFGALDLKAELAKAAAWIVSNPMQAPKSQLGRFLNAWFSKGQNQASLRSIPLERKTETKFKHCEYCQKIATGNVGGIWCCDGHTRDAMDRKPRVHMWGVQPKPVSGRE